MMVSPVLWSTTLSNLEPISVSPQPLMLLVTSESSASVCSAVVGGETAWGRNERGTRQEP